MFHSELHHITEATDACAAISVGTHTELYD